MCLETLLLTHRLLSLFPSIHTIHGSLSNCGKWNVTFFCVYSPDVRDTLAVMNHRSQKKQNKNLHFHVLWLSSWSGRRSCIFDNNRRTILGNRTVPGPGMGILISVFIYFIYKNKKPDLCLLQRRERWRYHSNEDTGPESSSSKPQFVTWMTQKKTGPDWKIERCGSASSVHGTAIYRHII